MIKTILLTLVFGLAGLASYSQTSEAVEKKSIIDKLDRFFQALEKQDTVLFKSILFTDGQLWVVKRNADSTGYTTRFFRDDIRRFNPGRVVQERPLRYDVTFHQDIAVAWVPYDLSINGKFSHCGVDVFTLFKTRKGWKIVTASYSVETEGCDDFRKRETKR